jgi:DNA-binding CsgD family transcriptional regulator
MDHLVIAYRGLLILLGIAASLLIFLIRGNKEYLRPFFWFYFLFTLFFFFGLVRGYIGVNVKAASLFYQYLGHGISGVLSFIILFFGIRTFHRYFGRRLFKREVLIGSVQLAGAVMMVLPFSVKYIAEQGAYLFKDLFYISSALYLLSLAYLVFFVFFNLRSILRHKDKWFGIFVGVFALAGLAESILSYYKALLEPLQKLSIADNGVSISSLPFIAFSVYLIYYGIRGLTPGGPVRGELDDAVFTRYQLTSRETDVVRLILKGLDNQRIADELNVSLATVKTHINNVFKKTGVSNRFELARMIETRG